MEANKHYCPICGTQKRYDPRYPKAICRACCSKPAYLVNGEALELHNHASGKLRVLFKDAEGSIIREDVSKLECECFIDNVLCVAEEARFGGIVIQKKD